uniref:catechol O-methyltransferase n=1 Tax=Chromera velia CCMP2878 TaxID=1169474 RepID=A0A0G4IF16_9ALVE|mmetsp:Transcript_49763/g.98066  ORF Transcript_49763/g.98066 Transcript_49763/m.98066 type:complete len:350 (+) Transcript_49763:105-1154(+)|eukprot:Cvel_13748.t1-p1 / transcript=Cvel_13748.t1 / gene=Cvel_13748 / organism=Chromera_velia_CCMP2878 / gene_product=Catechol O-methyltransferase, putative / transcript_product=Catechol O-methyltransferase, putative / location=Cvel_scaffold951:55097-58989(-) / protein_length=349 / sequence_SO=supercontig / SO=protein_coding / is_pseudo=false
MFFSSLFLVALWAWIFCASGAHAFSVPREGSAFIDRSRSPRGRTTRLKQHNRESRRHKLKETARRTGAVSLSYAGLLGARRPAEAQWQFRTPKDLLQFVQANAEKGSVDSVVNAIDEFSRRNWMMNVGAQKGDILDDVIRSLGTRVKRLLEVGTFCGYSICRISRVVPPDCRLVTVEKDKDTAAVAREVLSIAGLSNRVEVIQAAFRDVASEIPKKLGGPADVLFMDHWKNDYVKDVGVSEDVGLFKEGSLLAADNVLYPGAPGFIDWLDENEAAFKWQLLDVPFEYRPDIPDQMAFAVYRGRGIPAKCADESWGAVSMALDRGEQSIKQARVELEQRRESTPELQTLS